MRRIFVTLLFVFCTAFGPSCSAALSSVVVSWFFCIEIKKCYVARLATIILAFRLILAF
jgi:hypothetical protein